ncbi:MAG: ribonuclease P protein component [Anaerolineae bacterium]
MLPKQYRITRADDFKRIHSQGRSWSNSKLVLVQLGNGLSVSRFGFSVSRKIGSAVVRNRCKRLMREAVHNHLAEIITGFDFMFIARRGMLNATFRSTEKAVLELLRLAQALDERIIDQVG